MKVAIVLLLIALVFVQDSESRRFWRKVKSGIHRLATNVQQAVKVWNDAKKIWETIKAISGKRDVNSLDLNNDGHIDIEELAKLIEEREARDLIESMSQFSDRVPVQEFERNLRDLSDMAEEDIYNEFGQ